MKDERVVISIESEDPHKAPIPPEPSSMMVVLIDDSLSSARPTATNSLQTFKAVRTAQLPLAPVNRFGRRKWRRICLGDWWDEPLNLNEVDDLVVSIAPDSDEAPHPVVVLEADEYIPLMAPYIPLTVHGGNGEETTRTHWWE